MMSNHRLLRYAALLLLALSTLGISVSHARAQGAGRLVGRVVDATTGAGISAAQVELVGLQIGTLSTLDGRYVLNGVPAGQITLKVSSIGYSPKTVVGIVVAAGAVIEQNLTLDTEAVQIGPLQVSAAAERGSVNRALDQQRTATSIVNAITAEQISRSPDGDAAAALQRVSGVTVQDNKFVFVRGLGERYTTTSLNGARIPSPEPERKTVPLDLFPAGLLQTITTSKTFTPDLSGDFSGAQVNIETREFPANRQTTLSVGTGYNSRATGRSIPTAPTVGTEWLAVAGGDRQLPSLVEQAGKFDPRPPQPEVNQIINSFRNAWSPVSRDGSPNASLGLSVGGTDPFLGKNISYLGSLTYSRTQDVRAGQFRSQAQPDGNGGTAEINRFDGTTGNVAVLWGGLLQLSSLLSPSSRLVLNATYNRTADNEARSESGYSEQFAVPFDISRLTFVERNIFSAQLKGEHELSSRHRLDWVATVSGVNRNEPDRSEFVYFRPIDPTTNQPGEPEWLSASNEGAVRTFSELVERAYETSLNYRIGLGAEGRSYIKIGGVARHTDRDADSRIYSISANLPATERQLTPEEIFDGRHARGDDDAMRITTLFQGGSYTAAENLFAGYTMAELGLSSRLRLVAGARFESAGLEFEASPNIGAVSVRDTVYNDVLPAVALNMDLAENMNLRLSASQTLARPEYREIANVSYREVIGRENVVGNPNLIRTRIQNADLRWEWYPQAGEVISVALFGKRFQDPIERVYRPTSGTAVATFVNAEGATNYGIELELRKRLGTLSQSLEPWTVFTNATVMQSEIEIDESSVSITNPNRPMVGQAPYVVNAGLTYASLSGASSATLLYNVVGKRIVTAGDVPLPDVYEMSRNVLDVSLRFKLNSAISTKVDLKNLLDEPFEHRQGSVVREFYRAGRVVSVGLTWRN